MCENVAVNLNRMLRMTKILLSKIQSARKILLSGNQPVDPEVLIKSTMYFKNQTNWPPFGINVSFKLMELQTNSTLDANLNLQAFMQKAGVSLEARQE